MDKAGPIWLVLAVVAGMLLPLQPAINKELKYHVGSHWSAALVSFLVGTLLLVLMMLVMRPGLPSADSLIKAPWWAWLGGTIGAVFVTSSIVLVPKLGVVLLVGAVVFGQMISSVTIDHFGWVGMKREPISVLRVLGVALLLTGVVLIQVSTGRGATPLTEAEAEVAGE